MKLFALVCYRSFEENFALYQYNWYMTYITYLILYNLSSLIAIGSNTNESQLLPTDLITVR